VQTAQTAQTARINLINLNAAWPHERVIIRAMPNYPLIEKREGEADRIWLEARRTGRHGELFGKFRDAVFALEAALLDGLTTGKKQGK
jgi:hypothetical protein